MATGISVAVADDHLLQFTGSYVQFHTADPGAAGTTAVATATALRKQVAFGTGSTSTGNRRRSNTAIVRWEAAEVTGTQTITHWSLWSAATAGDFLWSDPLDTPLEMTAGQPSEIPVGGIVVEIGPIAS